QSWARGTSLSTNDGSDGTIISKSPGFCPRTRHCIASSPAILSTVQPKSAFEAARNCATPVFLSQKTNRLDKFASRFFCCCTSFGNARIFFTIGHPVCLPRVAFGKADFVLQFRSNTTSLRCVVNRNCSGPQEIVSFDLLRNRTAFPTAGPKRATSGQVLCQRFSIS